jgi:putative tryptophan/tyrosine transport system substrate-binding protein
MLSALRYSLLFLMQRAIAFFLSMLCLILWLSPALAGAAEALSVVTLSSTSATQERLVQGLLARLGEADAWSLKHIMLPRESDDALSAAGLDSLKAQLNSEGLILCVGSLASEAVLRVRQNQKVVAIGVPQTRAVEMLKKHTEPGLFILAAEQPFLRQAQLVRLVFPQAANVGVLVGPASTDLLEPLQAAFKKQGLRVHHAPVQDREDVLPALERLLGQSDLLLSAADPVVFNPVTIRAILLSAYRVRRVLAAHAESYVDAGALYALYSGQEDLINDALYLLQNTGAQNASELRYPRSFSVRINTHVARTLGMSLPSPQVLVEQLRAHEAPP